MKLFLISLLSIPLLAQTKVQVTADCSIAFSFTASGNTPVTAGNPNTGDNRQTACESWTLQYTSIGFSGVTLTIQSAPGPLVAGTFVTYAGTIDTGINPNTSTTGATTLAHNGAISIPWIRVNASLTGTGTLTGVLYGFKSGPMPGGPGGGGGGSGCPNPCPVEGTSSAGSPPVGPPVQTGGSDGTDIRVIRTDTTGRPIINQGIVTDLSPITQNITAQDSASTTTAVANAQNFITGIPTANSTASFALATGYDTMRLLVTGTWTGTLSVEGSPDGGTTWTTQGIHQPGTSYTTSTFTANFTGQGPIAGYTNVRVRSTAAWTGTATIRLDQTINGASVYVAGPIKLQDGTTQSTLGTVKPASTAAQATDTALVVAISPNSPPPPPSGTGTLITGQQAVTATAVALASHASNTVCVKAFQANTINVYIGPTGTTTSTGLELAPGAGYCSPLSNSNLVFVVASTTGASVSWAITD